MKHITAIIWLSALMPLSGFSTNLIWSKTLNLAGSLNAITVGEDGAVAISSGSSPILWYDRSGALIATPTNSNVSARSIEYLNENTLITITSSGSSNDIFCLEEDSSVSRTTIPDLYKHTIYTTPSLNTFNYPYYIQTSGSYTNYQVQLFDLTSSFSPKIVGDAVIGVHGSNLKVRWKSLMNSKYKVQTSTDLTTWTDYTDVLDGTGSTLIINIPLDENSDSLYARVVKL